MEKKKQRTKRDDSKQQKLAEKSKAKLVRIDDAEDLENVAGGMAACNIDSCVY